MRVYKDTPFEFSLMPWEVEPGRPVVMLVVKGSFDLGAETVCPISEAQQLVTGPLEHDDDRTSLQYASDYALHKLRAEWYLKGSAKSAGGEPTNALRVAVEVGDLKKEMVVWGQRYWKRGVLGGAPSEPISFTDMSLSWERAFGAPNHPMNPLGAGRTEVEIEGEPCIPLPNLEALDERVVSADGNYTPVGMFPIPGTWPQRVRHMGTFDEVWKRDRWPFFPADFNYAFYNMAPLDQQRDALWTGTETIVMEGLSAEHPRLRASLPGIRPRCFIEWESASVVTGGESSVADIDDEEFATEFDPEGADFDSMFEDATGETAVVAQLTPEELTELERNEDEEGPTLREQVEAAGVPTLQEVELRFDTILVDSDAMQVVGSWRGLTDVANSRLTNIKRLFFIHEPIDEAREHRHYEEWLYRLLLQEADEFEPPESPLDQAVAETDAEDESTDEEERDSDEELFEEIRASVDAGKVPTVEQLWALNAAMLPPTVMISREQAREEFRERELEIPEELAEEADPQIQPPPVDWDLQARSVKRFTAIIRRRLGKSFAEEDLSNAPYEGLDLSGVDFQDSILTTANLRRCNLQGCNFEGAILVDAALEASDLRGANFQDGDLSGANFERANFEGANLNDVLANDTVFRLSVMNRISATSASFEGADFRQVQCWESMLDSADFSGAQLSNADFRASSLVDAAMQGVTAKYLNLERCRASDLRASAGSDFSNARIVLVDAPRAQFQNARLSEANFGGSNLDDADFSESKGAKANFIRASLKNACFDFSELPMAMWIQVNLFEASFQEADVRGADFRAAQLYSTNFWRALIEGAFFEGASVDRSSIEEK